MSKTITLKRLFQGSDSTLGALYLSKEKPTCFIIEDEHRDVKVKGETRIDAGVYEVIKKTDVTPLTEKYRKKFDWFDFHLELQNVPRHKYIYIHIGNYEKNTDGCLLTNFDGKMLATGEYQGGRSTDAFKKVYQEVEKMLEVDRVFICVIDEQPLP